MKKRPIFIITGAPTSGKTTVSKALLNRYAFGVHIPVDNLRGMVTSGLSNPIGSWDDETDRQFRLARDSAALIAKTYAQAGFAAVIDDVIFPPQIAHHYDNALADFEVYKILIRSDPAISIARNSKRQLDFDNRLLEDVIQSVFNHFTTFDLDQLRADGWCILDSSQQTVEETVSELLACTGCFPA